MSTPLSFPRRAGITAPQAHADLPEGTYEREMGREGFYGAATNFYHRHPPTGWLDWDGPLRPRAFDLGRLAGAAASPFAATPVLDNVHVKYRFWRTEGRMSRLARNADGDELLFVHAGAGALFCDWGRLTLAEGDYAILPRGTMWRTEFDGAATLLLIEATDSAYRLPDKGLIGKHGIFDPAALAVPEMDEAFRAQQTPPGREGADPWEVEVKRRGAVSIARYAYNPLDAVGWQGDLAPVRLNWRDIRPVTSHRAHIAPSVHTTFVADRFVVCTFVPRPLETHPGALKVPYFHANDDYDEVIFYHAGNFVSRDGIGPGTLTLHPSGVTHGPHPKALATMNAPKPAMTDDVAVMLDARDALDVAALPAGIERVDYVHSWRANAPGAMAKAAE